MKEKNFEFFVTCFDYKTKYVATKDNEIRVKVTLDEALKRFEAAKRILKGEIKIN